MRVVIWRSCNWGCRAVGGHWARRQSCSTDSMNSTSCDRYFSNVVRALMEIKCVPKHPPRRNAKCLAPMASARLANQNLDEVLLPD